MKTRGSSYLLKYYDLWFLRKKYSGCNSSLGQFSGGSRRAVFLGAICPRDNYVDKKSSKKQFYLGAIIFGVIFWEQLSGDNHLVGSYPEGNVPRFAIVLRGICPERVQLSGGQFSSGAIIWGSIILGAIIQRAIVRRSNYLEELFLRSNCLDTIV